MAEYQGDNSFKKIELSELIFAINSAKKDSSPGVDNIHNLMLKNLPLVTLNQIVDLFNQSLSIGEVPASWKISKITMLLKKADLDPTNPDNYRPISLTSCLGKLLERIVCCRLNKFLSDSNFLINEQSGFRTKRRTTDNLYFLTQKVSESFNRKKKFVVYYSTFQKHLIKRGTTV